MLSTHCLMDSAKDAQKRLRIHRPVHHIRFKLSFLSKWPTDHVDFRHIEHKQRDGCRMVIKGELERGCQNQTYAGLKLTVDTVGADCIAVALPHHIGQFVSIKESCGSSDIQSNISCRIYERLTFGR